MSSETWPSFTNSPVRWSGLSSREAVEGVVVLDVDAMKEFCRNADSGVAVRLGVTGFAAFDWLYRNRPDIVEQLRLNRIAGE